MASPAQNARTASATETPEHDSHGNGLHDASSPKRKASEAATESHGGGPDSGKKKRRKVNHACVYCRRSHMTCDLERPCARCVKRDIGHLCHDEPRDPPKRSKSEVGIPEIAPAPEHQQLQAASPKRQSVAIAPMGGGAGGGVADAEIAQPKPVSPRMQRPPVIAQQESNPMMNFNWNSNANNGGLGGSQSQNQFQDMHHLHPNYMFNTSEATNEYNLLNDFLSSSLLDDGALYSNDDAQAFLSDPLLATSSINTLSSNLQQQQQQQQSQQQPGTQPVQPPSQPPPGNEISRPSSAFPVDNRARDRFFMTAADPAGNSSAEDRLHKLLKAKYDAGMLKPFNYVKGYARLNSYMESHLSAQSRMRILRQLDRFRPKFREAMHNLTDIQLVLVEMWFERSLMEYDRVFAAMAIPACCWRRTGEIFRGNREMADLINVPVQHLRDGKLAIHDIIAEDSLVSYWEKFGAIAFDQSQKAILTSCALKKPEGVTVGKEKEGSNGDGSAASGDGASGKLQRCCFSFTIKRDTHNIPSLIVGNFLPIRARSPS